MADGEIYDDFGERMPFPGNGRQKRIRVDAEGNAVFKEVYLRPAGTLARTPVSTSIRLSVKAFGAVGDGVTDDTVAFQTALASANDIFVPAGTYVLTGSLTMPANKTMTGTGVPSVLQSTANPVISLGSSAYIGHMHITGNSAVVGSSVVNVANAFNVLVQDTLIDGTSDIALNISSASYGRYVANRILGEVQAIVLTTGFMNMFAACYIATTGGASTQLVQLTTSNRNTWGDCTFEALNGASTYAVTLNATCAANSFFSVTTSNTTNDVNNLSAVASNSWTNGAGRGFFEDLSILPAGTTSRILVSDLAGVDVRQFGAVGDGVTDDSAAFTAALGSADCVHVPELTFAIASTLTIPANKSIIGCGINSKITSSANPGFILGSNCTVANVSLEGRNLTASAPVLQLTSTTASRLINVIVSGTADRALNTSAATYNRFIGCTLTGTNISTVLAAASAANMFSGCVFSTTAAAPAKISESASSNKNTFAACVWRSQSGTATIGHELTGTTTENFIMGQSLFNVTSGVTDSSGTGQNGYNNLAAVNTTGTYLRRGVQLLTEPQPAAGTTYIVATQASNPTADTRTAVIDVSAVTGTEEKKIAMLLNYLLTDLKTHGVIRTA